MFLRSSKDLAASVSRQRKLLGFTLEECAAWCNVGTRFLFDVENAKASLQLDKVLAVTARLGIKVSVSTLGNGVEGVGDAFETTTVTAPGFDGADWLASRAIGFLSARACNISICDQTFDRNNDRLNIVTSLYDEPLVKDYHGRALLREEQGGPGYREIFDAVDSRSHTPIEDARKLIRWACYTYLTADVTISASSVRFDERKGVLAPFGPIACASGEVGTERVCKGLRIGREWPDDWLRVDHWLDFAGQARVKPKIVLHAMSEMAESVPKAVREAAVTYSRSPMLRGAASTIVNIVHARSTRMRDLLQSATHQKVPVLKTVKPKA